MRRKARLRDLIDREPGGSKGMALRIGVSQAHVNHLSLEGYHFGKAAARNLERKLGKKHMYFDEALPANGRASTTIAVPLQPWADVGRHSPRVDAPTIAVPWEVGPRAVAVISHGAMWSGDGGVGVPRGWYAIIDPDAQVRDGDVVAVLLPGATEATLRQFVIDGGRRLLYPLDPRNTMIDEMTRSVQMCGPVVGALRSFRA